MATLTEVVRQLEESNKQSDKRHEEIKIELKKGISDVAKSISGIKSAGLKIPGLTALTNAIIDNPITRTLGAFKDSIVNIITAPFKLIANAVSTIKNAIIGIVSGIGKIVKDVITAPISAAFGLIKSIFSTNFEKENNKLLDKILIQMMFLNDQMKSYFDYLKLQKLDDLQQSSDDINIPNNQDPAAPQQQLNRGVGLMPAFSLAGVGKLLAGLGLAITAEFLGLDKYIKALFVTDTWKSLKSIPTRIVDTIGSAFKSLDNLVNNQFTKVGQSIAKTFRSITAGIMMFTSTLDFSRIAAFFEPITNVFKNIGSVLSKVTAPITATGKAVAQGGSILGSVFGTVGKFFGAMGKILSPITSILKPVLSAAKLFARFSFLLPLITLFDFVKGAITGFTEAEGGIISKLFGAFEGGIKGIITGILEGVDVLKDIVTFVPRKVLEYLGFGEIAQKIKDFSLADSFNSVYDGAKNFIKNFGENFGNLISGAGSFIKASFKSAITDRIKNTFESLATVFLNFKDKLITSLSKVGFSIPTLKIPIPSWLGGGEFTVLEGARVSLVSQEKATAAAQRIENRNAELIQRRNERERETNAMLERAQNQLASTVEAREANRAIAMVNNTDARSVQNNTTVLNQASMPISVDGFDRMAPI